MKIRWLVALTALLIAGCDNGFFLDVPADSSNSEDVLQAEQSSGESGGVVQGGDVVQEELPLVAICHQSTENEADFHTIYVDPADVQSQLDEGDQLGTCEEIYVTDGTVYNDNDSSDVIEDVPPEEDILMAVCHFSPRGFADGRTIYIDPYDLELHLDHGDFEGPCE